MSPTNVDLRKESHHQRAIEFLAEESQVPVNEVARLYEIARAELEVGARITSFLGIFCDPECPGNTASTQPLIREPPD